MDRNLSEFDITEKLLTGACCARDLEQSVDALEAQRAAIDAEQRQFDIKLRAVACDACVQLSEFVRQLMRLAPLATGSKSAANGEATGKHPTGNGHPTAYANS